MKRNLRFMLLGALHTRVQTVLSLRLSGATWGYRVAHAQV